MSVSLTWSQGWQASSGVMVDASPLYAGGAIDEVTAYGTVLVKPAVTLVMAFGMSDTPAGVYLTLSWLRTASVLIEESSDGVTWTTATVLQWRVWTGTAWTDITATDTAGVWTWASNLGSYSSGCFQAVLSTITHFLRVSVSDTASADSHIDVGYFNVAGTDDVYRGWIALPVDGPYMVYVPPVTAAIALTPTLAPPPGPP